MLWERRKRKEVTRKVAQGPRRWGSSHPGAAGWALAEASRCPLGWSGPALWASRVSELRHWGAAGRSTWMPVVGLVDETSARGRLCGVSLVRSSRRQPSTTERPGGDDRPQGGGAASIDLERQNRREHEPWRWSTVGKKKAYDKGGVKIIRAQKYAGVDIINDFTPLGRTNWLRMPRILANFWGVGYA